MGLRVVTQTQNRISILLSTEKKADSQSTPVLANGLLAFGTAAEFFARIWCLLFKFVCPDQAFP